MSMRTMYLPVIQLQIMALYNYMDIPIKIVYLDNSNSDQTNDLLLPETQGANAPWLELLYRPGHYDLVYRQ